MLHLISSIIFFYATLVSFFEKISFLKLTIDTSSSKLCMFTAIRIDIISQEISFAITLAKMYVPYIKYDFTIEYRSFLEKFRITIQVYDVHLRKFMIIRIWNTYQSPTKKLTALSQDASYIFLFKDLSCFLIGLLWNISGNVIKITSEFSQSCV